MNIVQQVVILSAEREELSGGENARRTLGLESVLEGAGLTFKPAKGFYKGSKENSFVVIIPSQAHIEGLLKLAKSFNQESILHQDSNQIARLLYADGRVEQLGKLVQVTKEVAQTLDGYTQMDDKF